MVMLHQFKINYNKIQRYSIHILRVIIDLCPMCCHPPILYSVPSLVPTDDVLHGCILNSIGNIEISVYCWGLTILHTISQHFEVQYLEQKTWNKPTSSF